MSPVYLSLRLLAWIGAATIQAIRIGAFASSQSSVPSITYMIAGNTCLFAIRDILLLTYETESDSRSPPSLPLSLVLSLFNGLVDAFFMAILLFISSGYCITTHILRELPSVAFVLPTLFFLASVSFTRLGNRVVSGLAIIHFLQTFAWVPELYDLNLESSSWELKLAVAAGFVQAIIAVMAWMAVIENSESIAKQLDEIAPRTEQQEAEAAGQFTISDAVEDGPDGFQPVTEHVATVAEEVERSQQATLMRRFKIAVTVYMIAFVAAFFVPAYGKDKDESQVILALWNVLLLLFLLSLAWVFRTRDEANPYIHVGEDEAQNVHLDTRIELQGMPVIPEEDAIGSPNESNSPEQSEAAVHSPTIPSAQPTSPKPSGAPDTSSRVDSPNGKACNEVRKQGIPNGKDALGDDVELD